MNLDVFQHHIHNYGFKHQTQHAKKPGFHAKGEACRDGNQKIHTHQAVANIDIGFFLQQHRHNIRPAAGSLHVEEDRAADRGQRYRKNQL